MHKPETQGLQQYLYEHIPLSRAMGVEVMEAGYDEARLSAPLAPNINHRETVFGGSASAVAILAAWTLLYLRLRREGLDSRVVIQRNEMSYERPIAGRFEAVATLSDPPGWDRFVRMLDRHRRARITVESVLFYEGERAGLLRGEFVALRGPGT